MFEKNQVQSQDGSGTAIQASGNVTVIVKNEGVSVSAVREIALDVFRANLMEFRGIAQQTALSRGEEVTEKFITKLQTENPDGLQKAQFPDFQDALFTVQKEYAKAGDAELGDLLVDLLVDRTKQENRSLIQIVLTESLHTAPKLTQGQIACLSVIFLLRYVKYENVNVIQNLAAIYRTHLGPIVANLTHSEANLKHLEFTGCGTKAVTSIQLEEIWRRTYPGLFKLGFDAERLTQANLGVAAKTLLMPCLNDPTKNQLAALNEAVLEARMAERLVPDEERQRIKVLFAEGDMASQAIKGKVLESAPFLEGVLTAWPNSAMQNFELNSVGIAIAHANIKRFVGEFSALSIWIN